MNVAPQTLAPIEFALWLSATQGAASYAAYIVEAEEASEVLRDVEQELRSLGLATRILDAAPGSALLANLPASAGNLLLIDACLYRHDDWALLDRRRSALQRNDGTVFFTSPASFDELMRVAPNLASWLGGAVFRAPSEADARAEHQLAREERLESLRSWSGESDETVLEKAKQRTLPRDPEYAEWLVLLGREDLLNA